MKAQHVRDVALIAVVVAIAIVALLPGRGQEPEDVAAGTARATPDAKAAPGREKAAASAPVRAAGGGRREDPAARPVFPMPGGASWVYHVEGPRDLVPDDRWTMEVRSPSTGGAPGEVAVGFGVERAMHPFWIDGGAVRLAALPLVEPVELRGVLASGVEGFLVPARRGLTDGATWSLRLEREGSHEMTDSKGRTALVPVRGVETDRALAGETADVTVPAGRFSARRIDWTGRIELTAGARPVLDPLTAKPFRTEVMWVAEGVGIVRRRLEHAIPSRAVVTFDLVSYTLPPPAGGD